nr:MAG TPA: hypothetical protein [Caudoviricetes sp.]
MQVFSIIVFFHRLYLLVVERHNCRINDFNLHHSHIHVNIYYCC